MKCHIVQNGGHMFLILCVWMTTACSTVLNQVFTIQKYCSSNGFLQNIEAGDTYKLTLESEATSDKDKWYQAKTKRICMKEFKTSDPAAHFIVDITDMNIPSCSNCRCNYFEITALAHKKKFCGTRETEIFLSKSDRVSIEFYPSLKLGFNVTLTFTVERNVYEISGYPSENNQVISSYLETPYFPLPYPPSYRAEYILQTDLNSHVILLFLDFQISNSSFIEVYGNNGSHPTRFFGGIFRPPVIVSQSNQLNIKFQSSSEFHMPGFRALTSFVKTVDYLSVPHTDCGGLKDGRGGYMNISTLKVFSLYDCVWRIVHFFLNSVKMSLSVSIKLKDIGFKSSLEFRKGPNSKAEVLKIISCEIEDCSNLNAEMIVPATSDLYIRFNGYLDVYSVLNISYSPYHTENCSVTEFLCEDGRCLHLDFHCDGIKQCPSGSDEQNCLSTALPEVHTTSVLKENVDDNAVYKKFFIILLVGSFGLVAVLVAVFIFIYKFKKAPTANVEQAQTQLIGQISDAIPSLYPNNPCTNDNPPSYEDFVKAKDCYPPLLYIKAKHTFMSPKDCKHCTTSFSMESRYRHYSDNSSTFKSSEPGSDLFIGASSEGSGQPYPDQCNNNCLCSSIIPKTSSTVKKWFSLDSKLNELVKHNTCHLFYSVIHPVCNSESDHLTHLQCHTLPTNFKISNTKTSTNDRVQLQETLWLPSCSGSIGLTDRRCTVSHSAGRSEVLTIIKARCCSDPCRPLQVHYSFH